MFSQESGANSFFLQMKRDFFPSLLFSYFSIVSCFVASAIVHVKIIGVLGNQPSDKKCRDKIKKPEGIDGIFQSCKDTNQNDVLVITNSGFYQVIFLFNYIAPR